MNRILHTLLFLTIPIVAALAQDLEKLKDLKSISAKNVLKKGIKVSGMVGANFVYYNANGIEGRNIPFNTLFTGNLNIDLFGKIKMPLMFSLSNQNINWSHPFDKNHQFIQPFNRFVFKPTYKGFTLHVGVCALNFSPFTLAGHRYDGIGLEYKPKEKPFYAGLMIGNLKRAIHVDSSFQTDNNIPSYKRPGWGFQAGYRKKEDRAEVIFFRAKDVIRSLPYTLDSYHISPEQNAVLSLKGAKSLYKKWLIEGEIAVSGINQDMRAAVSDISSNIFTSYFGVLPVSTATDYNKAIKGAATYRGQGFNTGLEYSRIDPGYRTLGAYYFANDLQTYSGKVATQLLKGKLNFSANIGLQQDNVEKQKLKTLSRWVGATNITYTPVEWATVLVNYSNFTSFSNLRPVYDYLRQVTPYQALDTLNFRQINQNIQGSISLTLPSRNKAVTQNLGLNVVIQKGTDSQGSQNTQNNLSNISLDYSYGVKPLKLNTSLSLYYSQNNTAGINGTQWGPSLNVTKGFGSEQGVQWKTMASITYSPGKMSGGTPAGLPGETSGVQQKMFNARAGLNAGITKQLNLNLNVIYLNRSNVSAERSIPSFSEITGTVGLVYNFSVL